MQRDKFFSSLSKKEKKKNGLITKQIGTTSKCTIPDELAHKIAKLWLPFLLISLFILHSPPLLLYI